MFHALPLTDLAVPGDTREFLAALGPLADRVRAGAHVAVHCRASIGRSGIIAVLLLALNGWEPEAAITHLSALRGRAIPETDEQRAWVRAAAEIATRTPQPIPPEWL
ncbi:MAG TPA: hypothetical protein VGX23_28175 [Actinocrinis sp.]|nr:hypothetical protein [Actinocrinis sp.]